MKFFSPLILLGLSIGIFFWYIKPTLANVKELGAEATQYSQALDRANRAQSLRDTLLTTYHGISKDNVDRLGKIIPDNIDNLKLVVEMNSIAAKYGTNIKNIGVSDTSDPSRFSVDGKQYLTVPFTFGVSLTYQNFLSFLTDLEQNLRLTDISTINFAPSGDSSIYDFTLMVNNYRLK